MQIIVIGQCIQFVFACADTPPRQVSRDSVKKEPNSQLRQQQSRGRGVGRRAGVLSTCAGSPCPPHFISALVCSPRSPSARCACWRYATPDRRPRRRSVIGAEEEAASASPCVICRVLVDQFAGAAAQEIVRRHRGVQVGQGCGRGARRLWLTLAVLQPGRDLLAAEHPRVWPANEQCMRHEWACDGVSTLVDPRTYRQVGHRVQSSGGELRFRGTRRCGRRDGVGRDRK